MVKEVNFEDVKRDVIHAFTNGCQSSESVLYCKQALDLGMEMTYGHRDWIHSVLRWRKCTWSCSCGDDVAWKVFGRVIPEIRYEKCNLLVRELTTMS